MKEEKKITISCLINAIKELETEKGGAEHHIQQKSDEIPNITAWWKTDIYSSKNLKTISKERQDTNKMICNIFELL